MRSSMHALVFAEEFCRINIFKLPVYQNKSILSVPLAAFWAPPLWPLCACVAGFTALQ